MIASAKIWFFIVWMGGGVQAWDIQGPYTRAHCDEVRVAHDRAAVRRAHGREIFWAYCTQE